MSALTLIKWMFCSAVVTSEFHKNIRLQAPIIRSSYWCTRWCSYCDLVGPGICKHAASRIGSVGHCVFNFMKELKSPPPRSEHYDVPPTTAQDADVVKVMSSYDA